MPKMMAPLTTIWWVDNPAYNPDTPSAAMLTAAANISGAIESGYTLGATASEKDTSTTIVDSANVETPTAYNYEGSLTFFREGDSADTTSAFARAFAFFKDGLRTTPVAKRTGFLVKRVGYLNTVAAAVGQEVESYKFQFSNPKDEVVDKGPIKFSMKFHPQGQMSLSKVLVA